MPEIRSLFKNRIAVVAGSIIFYTVFLISFFWLLGRSIITFSIIPVITAAFIYGWKGGLLTAAFTGILNIILFLAAGEEDLSAFLGLKFLFSHMVFIITGVSVGYLFELKSKLEQELIKRKEAEEEKEKVIIDLKNALNLINRLSDIIPICSVCKKIRNDKGYWEQVEKNITEHTGSSFSHGICHDCMKDHYSEYRD